VVKNHDPTKHSALAANSPATPAKPGAVATPKSVDPIAKSQD